MAELIRTDNIPRRRAPRNARHKLTHYIADGLVAAAGDELAHTPLRVDGTSLINTVESALEHVLSEMLAVPRPPLLDIIPTSMTAPRGSDSVSFREIIGGGEMKAISGGGQMPMMGLSSKKIRVNIEGFALGWGYSYQEMLRCALEGVNLDSTYAMEARRAYFEKVEEIALIGDVNTDMRGLINSARVPRVKLTLNGTDSTGAIIPDGSDSSVTAAQIKTALLRFLNDCANGSNSSARAEGVLAVPGQMYRHITQTSVDTTNKETLAEEIQRLTGVRVVESVRLANVDGSRCGLIANSAYQWIALINPSSMAVEQHLPHPHEVFPVQQSGLNFVVPTYAEIGDLAIKNPLAHRVAYFQQS